MALCQRCYKSPPIYDCSICKGYYCLSCDEYIHSFPSKKLHTRRILDVATAINTESPKQTEENINSTEANINVIKETLPIYDSNIGKSSTIFNSDYTKYEKGPFIDIDEKYLQGNTNIEDKIEELTCNLENTKINLSERIDVLDDHIHKINEINKDDLININSRNLKEINDITSEKDYEINQLQLIIEKQKEKIRELKDVNRMLENELINSIKLKNQSLKERDEALDDKKAQEKAFIKDLDEMILSQEDEKKKLVNGYEDKFIKTNSDYHDEKDKLLNELKAIQENFESLKVEHEKNIEKLNDNKVKLDADNKRRDLENEQLKKEEENLKENLKRTKTKIDEIEEEMKSNDLVNLQWAKELETMSTKTEQIKKANTILGKSCFRSAYRPEV
jgi:DNA repair exonuclease SbcCD ATPase subunit